MPGFHDWGAWWQGEIAGEYFLSNSNLVSHQIRVHAEPVETVSGGVMLYGFRLDEPLLPAPAVAGRHVALEVDVYADWSLTANLQLSIVTAFANPGEAVERSTGRTRNFTYGMVYLGYSF